MEQADKPQGYMIYESNGEFTLELWSFADQTYKVFGRYKSFEEAKNYAPLQAPLLSEESGEERIK